MQTMTVRGSPILRNMLVAAAIVIVVFGLKYASDVLAPIFFAATLAILFTPALRWLEKNGCAGSTQHHGIRHDHTCQVSDQCCAGITWQ